MTLSAEDRWSDSIVAQVVSAAERQQMALPAGWKAAVALHLVRQWIEADTALPPETLDRAGALFAATTP